jgi:hypothetical protein
VLQHEGTGLCGISQPQERTAMRIGAGRDAPNSIE